MIIDNKNIILIIVIILLIFFMTFLFLHLYNFNEDNNNQKKIKRNKRKKHNENINLDDQNKQYKLILFSTQWCSVCKVIKPVWDDLKNNINNKDALKNIECVNVDCDLDKDESFVFDNGVKKQIEGVPTITLRHNNKDIEYNGDHNLDDLLKFVRLNTT